MVSGFRGMGLGVVFLSYRQNKFMQGLGGRGWVSRLLGIVRSLGLLKL